MPERFKPSDYAPYSVGEWGNVRNDVSGRILAPSNNRDMVLYVALIVDGRQFNRSVARLVGEVWCPNDNPDVFDTIIHKDGNKMNCFADNLAWRPRGYAINYNRQFRGNTQQSGRFNLGSPPFTEMTSGYPKAFSSTAEAGVTFGVLDRDITSNLSANALRRHYGKDLVALEPFGYVFAYL